MARFPTSLVTPQDVSMTDVSVTVQIVIKLKILILSITCVRVCVYQILDVEIKMLEEGGNTIITLSALVQITRSVSPAFIDFHRALDSLPQTNYEQSYTVYFEVQKQYVS